jgi:predicted O-methyltransferase YrrM
MKTMTLAEFFKCVGYDWKKDKDSVGEICRLTKTRVDPRITEFAFTSGMEQTFMVKAVAGWIGADSFFEIGTGRGTACYAVALLDKIQEIITVDIVPFNQKFVTAIGYKKRFVSNKDLRKMIPFDSKKKIRFVLRKRLKGLIEGRKDCFDLCFMDGNHDSKEVVYKDYYICDNLMRKNGIMVFNDYDNRFVVKEVVDDLVKTHGLHAILVETRGHLFEGNREKNQGMALVSHKEFVF